jgi:hypothetical protein
MATLHDPVSFPTDPHPVRPGTSAALTARTIDATVHPPLVRAQETVAAAIPRLTETVSDPLFLATLAGTLVLMWMAVRMRARLAPVLLAALMMMTFTSFRPGNPEEVRLVDRVVAEDDQPSTRFGRREAAPPTPEPGPFEFRVPTRPETLRPDVDRIRDDEEEMRAAIEDLRHRIEMELRQRGHRSYYEVHSARWMRRLPRSVQHWMVEGQRAVASRDWNP